MEEKDTDNYLKLIEEAIYKAPLSLLSISNENIKKFIRVNYLSYSIGMEFECYQNDNYSEKSFREIPNIIAVEVDNYEQRYRIPNGIEGLICLYNITIQLKLNSKIDLGSSNHYHFNFTDIDNKEALRTQENKNYILSELVKWETAKDLSEQNSWIRFFNGLGTLEIRIGEPSFDYEIIVKRLIDGCRISRFIKNQSSPEEKLKNINQQLKQLNITEKDLNEIDEYRKIINSRVIKLY